MRRIARRCALALSLLALARSGSSGQAPRAGTPAAYILDLNGALSLAQSAALPQSPGAQPITLTLALPLDQSVASWLSASSGAPAGAQPKRDGGLVAVDNTHQVLGRATFRRATIARVSLPALSVGSTAPVTLGLTLAPATELPDTTLDPMYGGGWSTATHAIAGGFRLRIDGLDTQHVAEISAYSTPTTGGCGALVIVVAAITAAAFESARTPAAVSRNGSLELLTTDQHRALRLQWTGLRVTNVGPVLRGTSGEVRQAVLTCDRVTVTAP